jgi:hypothetical protein
MTDEQIKQQIAQSEQDAITLDYTKWSAQRIQAKLPNDHSLWQFERDRTLARQKWDNAAARRKHLEGLEIARNAKQAEADAQIELELQPEKRRLQNEWLANNPTQTAADFEKKAWIHLRQNLIEQRTKEAFEAELQAQRASGRYSL